MNAKEDIIMSKDQRPTPRKPATKFPQLQKKLQQQKVPTKRPTGQQGRRGNR